MFVLPCAGPIPKELGDFAELKVLRLDHNKLTGEGEPMKMLTSTFNRQDTLFKKSGLLTIFPPSSYLVQDLYPRR